MEKYYVEINNVEYEVLVRSEPKTESKDKKLSQTEVEREDFYNKQSKADSSQINTSQLSTEQNTSSQKFSENYDLRSVKSPMASTVLSIDVSEGDMVAKDQLILVIEAMKMETEIAAPAAGEILKIKAEPGSHCSQGEELVVIRETGDK